MEGIGTEIGAAIGAAFVAIVIGLTTWLINAQKKLGAEQEKRADSLTTLREEVERIHRENSRLHLARENDQTAIKQLQDGLDTQNLNIITLTNANQNLQRDLNEMSKKYENVLELLNKKEATIDKLQDDLNKERTERQALDTKLKDAMLEMKIAQAELRGLKMAFERPIQIFINEKPPEPDGGGDNPKPPKIAPIDKKEKAA